jgi:hypothetical protein
VPPLAALEGEGDGDGDGDVAPDYSPIRVVALKFAEYLIPPRHCGRCAVTKFSF